MAKNIPIIFISDMNPAGSGYKFIATQLCNGLIEHGYEVYCLGLGYDGSEHNNKFKILPVQTLQECHVILNNLKILKGIERVVVALDIPMQEQFIPLVKKMGMKMVTITPLESEPLCMSWAISLGSADKVFFISQLGADEAKKAGLNAEHIKIGIDAISWRLRTQEEYHKGREMMNISPDTFVILTVADNQERKNLSKAFEIVSKLKHEKNLKVKYILVTREGAQIGWKLRDMAMSPYKPEVGNYDIASELMIFERGLPFKELYILYAVSDAFLLTSKAEGLGMPVLEAMAVGVPVVATRTGALPELLEQGRGFLMDTEYTFLDPWGNGNRHAPSANSGATLLHEIYLDKMLLFKDENKYTLLSQIGKARQYIETRTWDIPIKQLVDSLEKLDEQKTEQLQTDPS